MNRHTLDTVRRILVAGGLVVAMGASIVATGARRADAQIPGAPILQNAWATPGLVGALNFGGGSDGTVFAAAASWSPASGRFQLSGGGGAQTRTGKGSRGVYGVRAAIPFGGAQSSFGFAAFAGVGGGNGGTSAFPDSISSTTEVPIGVGIGWRRAIGANHGVSIYATPAYVLFSGGSKNGSLFRGSLGSDVGITPALGATVGVEFGGTRPRGYGGPSGTIFGLGVSYAFGRR
jgi:hypothetical protein